MDRARRCVSLGLGLFAIAKQIGRIVVGGATGVEAEIIIEPALERMLAAAGVHPGLHLRQMPLPNDGCSIPTLLQKLHGKQLVRRNASLFDVPIDVSAKSLRITRRHDRRARRSTQRAGDIGVRESRTLSRQPREIRRSGLHRFQRGRGRDLLLVPVRDDRVELLQIEHVGVRSELAIAQVVHQQEDDAGPLARALSAGRRTAHSRACEA